MEFGTHFASGKDVSRWAFTSMLHKDLFIPHPFRGLVASLSEFQTLLAESIAERDSSLFAEALEAYPMHQFQSSRKAFFRKMFEIYAAAGIDPEMLKAVEYFK